MNDIYEHKAKKYKYKYLKLKNELEGGAFFDFLKNEKTIIEEIIKELNKLNQRIRITVIPNYIQFCKSSYDHGNLGFISKDLNRQGIVTGSLINKKSYCHAEMGFIKKYIMDNSEKTNKYKYPEIVTYFFNIENKWKYNHYDKKYEDAKFEFKDLQDLKNKFDNNKYPYYKNLIIALNNDIKIKDFGKCRREDNCERPYDFKAFYTIYIAPIVKNIDIYLIVMTIKELFDRYTKQLKNKYKEIYTLVDNLVDDAYNNKMLLIKETKKTKEDLINEQEELQTKFKKNITEGINTSQKDHERNTEITNILNNYEEYIKNIPTVSEQIQTIIDYIPTATTPTPTTTQK